MKICVISDLHLGFRQYGSEEREQDFYNQFYKVCKEINKHDPNIVIIAGDLFNKPNPSPAAINAYRNGVLSLNADIVCTIKGNHTMLLKDEHYAIDEFFADEEINGYYYLDDLSMTTSGFGFDSPYDADFQKYVNTNVQIDGITYRTNSSIDEFLEIQEELAERESGEEMYRVLVVHQSFKEFCGFIGEELSIKDIDYSPYDVVICGHIHSRLDTKLPNGTWFIQPGSIERMNTTEALDEQKNGKGFYLIDTTENSIEFYQVPCDREFFLGEIKIQSKEDLEKHLEKLDNDIKKLDKTPIISYNYHSDIDNINQVREMIGRIDDNVLLNKSNIHNDDEEEIVLEIVDSEIPTIIEAIQTYGKESNLNDDEVKLAVDLYNVLGKGDGECIGLLDNYYKKHKKEYVEQENYDDLDEIIEYFSK